MIRWALRLFRREWRQQLLVITLVTVAVGAAVFAATAAYNVAPSRDAEFGTANTRLGFRVSDPQALEPYLAAAKEWFGTVEVIAEREAPIPGSTDAVVIRAQDPAGPYGSLMLALVTGRYPAADGEVSLTDAVAAAYGVDVGDVVALDGDERSVVGTVENPGALDDEFALVARSAADQPSAVTILVQATADRVRSFRPAEEPGPHFVDTRGQTEKATAAVLVLAVATVAMVLVSLVAGAGFATLAHRRLRQLGMLAAVGATPRHLRLVMIANGAAVGGVAAALGTAFALAGWIGFAPTFEAAAGHRLSRADVPWWLIAAGAALAVGTATVASWWPARSVARVPITEALSARPPRLRTARRSALVAALLLVVGVAGIATGNDPSTDTTNPALFIPGVLATVAAVLFMASPAIRGAARSARRVPVAVRLALRDLARYQARSSAALGAISLALAIAVSVVVIAASAEFASDEGNVSDRQVVVWTGSPDDFGDLLFPERSPSEIVGLEAVTEEIARAVDADTVLPLDVAVDPTISEGRNLQTVRSPAAQAFRVGPETLRFSGSVFVATRELLGYLGIDPEAVDLETLLLTTQAGDVYLTGNISSTRFRTDPVPAPAVQRIDVAGYGSLPRSLLTPAGLEAAGLVPMRAGWLVEADAPITDSQRNRARELAADAGLTVEFRDEQAGLGTLRTSASVAGVLLALGILAMTVGLIRGEAAQDLRTLAATGATTRTRRALTASTVGVLAVLGVLLGGSIAYTALLAGYWRDIGRLAPVPVAHLAGIAFGLPLLATVVSWAVAGREPEVLVRKAIE